MPPCSDGGRTKYPIYFAHRFHEYSDWPNKIEPDIDERKMQAINEYTHINSVIENKGLPW